MNTSRRGQRPGQAIDVFVKNTYEALHVSPAKVSIGPVPGIPLELTGSISTNSNTINLTSIKNSITLSGSTSISGSTEVSSAWLDALEYMNIPTSSYGLVMDGGIITTDNSNLYRKISILRNLGSVKKNLHEHEGLNSRLDTLQASVLLKKIKSSHAPVPINLTMLGSMS